MLFHSSTSTCESGCSHQIPLCLFYVWCDIRNIYFQTVFVIIVSNIRDVCWYSHFHICMILKCGTYIIYRCCCHQVIQDKYAVHFLHCLDHIQGAGLHWLLIVYNLTEENLNYCWCKKNVLACYIGIHVTCYYVYATYSGLQCCHLCCVCSFQCLFVFISQNISC